MIVFATLVSVVLFLVGALLFIVRESNVGVALCFIAVLGGGGFITLAKAHHNERTIECTVTEKDRSANRDGGSNYRVYTEECGVFVNEDSFLRGKFDSADIQAEIKVGNTYELTVAGPRFGLFSWFPNIFDVREVK